MKNNRIEKTVKTPALKQNVEKRQTPPVSCRSAAESAAKIRKAERLSRKLYRVIKIGQN